ncbi:hypothetical protein BKA67DRAFT_363837 [Truncatella angustata]|uniref:Uncharacterized protein n=1 Tax=Truncatella angustata TaxID=152316 RepID=A0A9P8UEF0_9PEZI|nr:uncharacterized protein BKA67DRAFT_363837 [Truncatella angustata]KAH6648433.1 hypothetical protein BKA67DRAFT_363837 [Truncatella angustata]
MYRPTNSITYLLISNRSAYLDSEQRIIAARVIKRFIMHAKKTAFIVEHDFIMATYLADRVIVFDGQPGVDAHANTPQSLLTGCNTFLKNLDVTFRRDPTNYRPRINKLNSQLDQEQKSAGNYVSKHALYELISMLIIDSSSWRRIVLEKVVGQKKDRKENSGRYESYDSHEHASSSGTGVLGVKNKIKRRATGAHSGLDEEDGDEANEPND